MSQFPALRFLELRLWLGALLLGWLALGSSMAHAGGENSLQYVRDFLTTYPAFRAEGTMTSVLPGKEPYRCRMEILFKKGGIMEFRYNTNGAKNIIPYDYFFENQRLWELIFNRDRSTLISKTEVGAPTRTLFNFVAELLEEAEKGAGLRSLVFNGLMSVEQNLVADQTQMTLERRFPGIPVKLVTFSFDEEKRLKSLKILQADGSEHRIVIRRFRPVRD